MTETVVKKTLAPGNLARITVVLTLLLPLLVSGLAEAASEARKASKIGARYYISINDAAVLLGATKYWNGETRKAVLNVEGTRVRVTVGSSIVAVGESTYVMSAPVLFVRGVPFIPVELFSEILPGVLNKRMVWDPDTESLSSLKEGLTPVRVNLYIEGDVTYVTVESPERVQYSQVSSSSDAFVVMLDNCGLVGKSLPRRAGLVNELSAAASGAGVELRLSLARGTLGYSLKRETAPERLVFGFTSSQEVLQGAEYSPFGTELPSGTYHVVVIDAGHGGGDDGVKGPGSVEKDINLAIARELRAMLNASSSLNAVLTRTDDSGPSHENRAARASEAEGDLFVSIHCDGYPGPEASGYSVTVYEDAGRASPGVPPGREGVVAVGWREAPAKHVRASASLARAISRSLAEVQGLKNAGFRRAPVALFHGVDMPAVLVSCGFLTNPGDEAMLRDSSGQRRIAAAVARGIVDFVSGGRR